MTIIIGTSNLKACSSCGYQIVSSAKICSNCKEHQDRWRNELRYWAAIAGLIALVGSGLALMIGFGKSAIDYLFPPDVVVLDYDSFGDVTIANPSNQHVLVKFLHVYSALPNQKLQWKVRWDINQTIEPNKALSVSLIEIGKKQFEGLANELFGKRHGRYSQNLSATVREEILGYRRGSDYVPVFLKRDGTEYRQLNEEIGNRITVFPCLAELGFLFLQNNKERHKALPCIGVIKDRDKRSAK